MLFTHACASFEEGMVHFSLCVYPTAVPRREKGENNLCLQTEKPCGCEWLVTVFCLFGVFLSLS